MGGGGTRVRLLAHKDATSDFESFTTCCCFLFRGLWLALDYSVGASCLGTSGVGRSTVTLTASSRRLNDSQHPAQAHCIRSRSRDWVARSFQGLAGSVNGARALRAEGRSPSPALRAELVQAIGSLEV